MKSTFCFIECVAEAQHLGNIQSTQQGLPFQKNSIMNLYSKTGTLRNGSLSPGDFACHSTARDEPWGRDYVDFLHINILYCGGMYSVYMKECEMQHTCFVGLKMDQCYWFLHHGSVKLVN